MNKQSLTDNFLAACFQSGIPHPELEYRFHPVRRWRFDFAWPSIMLAVEVQGGGQFGRHARPEGMARDHEKLNIAQLMGWRVLQCTTREALSDETFALIREAFRLHAATVDAWPDDAVVSIPSHLRGVSDE